MQKELRKLKQCNQGVATANKLLDAATANYDDQIEVIEHVLKEVKEKRAADPDVQQATEDLKNLGSLCVDARELAEQAVIDYWKEFGFSTGKKSVIMEGCQLRIRETTSRQVVDPGVVVQAAINDGVGDKVVRELRPIFNKAAFNSWVDLKAPPGVEVIHAVTASVTILEEG